MKTLFTGFSTVADNGARRNFKLYDLPLIQQDLINHFYTRVGERVLRPEFGCRIWDYLMEPFTAHVQELCVQEATRIVEADPRVNLVSLVVNALPNGLTLQMMLDYVPLDSVQPFVLDFENRPFA